MRRAGGRAGGWAAGEEGRASEHRRASEQTSEQTNERALASGWRASDCKEYVRTSIKVHSDKYPLEEDAADGEADDVDGE